MRGIPKQMEAKNDNTPFQPVQILRNPAPNPGHGPGRIHPSKQSNNHIHSRSDEPTKVTLEKTESEDKGKD